MRPEPDFQVLDALKRLGPVRIEVIVEDLNENGGRIRRVKKDRVQKSLNRLAREGRVERRDLAGSSGHAVEWRLKE